jgi:hypothetical protein
MNACRKKRNKISTFFLIYICAISVAVTATYGAPKPLKLDVKLSSNLKDVQTAKYRVVFTNHPAAFGEVQAVHRLTKAASNLGWEWAIVECVDKQPEYVVKLKPNFVISLRAEIQPVSGAINLLYLHAPMFMFVNKEGIFRDKDYPHVLKYDGFLSVIPDSKPIQVAYEALNHKRFYNVNTVFGVQSTEFKNTPKTCLCHWGCIWDKARGSDNYQRFYHMLDQTGYFDLYGHPCSWTKMNLTSYRGLLPMDDHSVVDAISKCGIALVLHSHEHIKGGVPTSRIFEAAAASAVIICDQHPFVEKEFGDSVLYIDPNQDPEAVFKQIDDHVKWVHANPDKAIELARRSHTIFMERFTLENELKKIAEMYESMVK